MYNLQEMLTGRPIQGRVSTEEVIKLLNERVDAIRSSEKWKEYVKFMSTFYQYSYFNSMLIMMQRPDAEQVKGFQTWKKFGRYVKQGEKGIAILAPQMRKLPREIIVKSTDPVTKEEKEEKKVTMVESLVGFLTVYVFDIKQTEGKELPCVNEFVKIISSSSMEERFEVLKNVVQKNGIPLEFMELNVGKGYYAPAANKIVVGNNYAIDQQFKTLIHELCHALIWTKNLKIKREKDKPEWSPSEEECVVESTAFIVAHNFGLDTIGYSAGYVAEYQDRISVDVLRQDLSLIHELSETIIKDMESVTRTEV